MGGQPLRGSIDVFSGQILFIDFKQYLFVQIVIVRQKKKNLHTE